MKYFRLGEVKDKSFLPNDKKFFVALKDVTSGLYLYYVNRGAELELVTSNELGRYYELQWQVEHVLYDEFFFGLWDWCFSNLGQKLSADEFFRSMKSLLKKDPRCSHFANFMSKEDFVTYYTDQNFLRSGGPLK